MCIVFCSAGDYGDMAVRLFKTLRFWYSDAVLHYDAIGCPPAPLQALRQLGVEVHEVSAEQVEAVWPGLPKSAVCNNWRMPMLRALLAQRGQPVFWIDSDAFVLWPFPALLKQLHDYDLAAAVRMPEQKALGGFLGFNNTPKALELLRYWQELVTRNALRWRNFANQPCLNTAIREQCPKLLALDPMEYIDERGGDRSRVVAWSNQKRCGRWNKLVRWADQLCLTRVT